MGIPETIYIILVGASLGTSVATHGKERTRKEDFFFTFLAQLIMCGLLYWGGFFD